MLRHMTPCRVRHLTLLGLAIVCGVAGHASPPASPEVLLRWRNGDELSGRLLEGSDGSVRLSAAPFAAPLDLRPGQLTGLRFGAGEGGPNGAATSDFEIMLGSCSMASA